MTEDKLSFIIKPYSRRIEKPWGYEILLTHSDSPVTGKILHLNSGCRLSLQYHDKKDEILTLIAGKALIIIENENGQLQEIGMVPYKGYHIQPLQKHRVKGISDCDIVEHSTLEKGDTVRVEDDYKRGTETEEIRSLPNRGWENGKK